MSSRKSRKTGYGEELPRSDHNLDNDLNDALSEWARWVHAFSDLIDPLTPLKDGLEILTQGWKDPQGKSNTY